MSNSFLIIYMVVIIGVMIVVTILPQRRERKKREQMYSSMSVGDYCCTTSGMYGKIIDITKDMVIVEFGSKSCRIPMLKGAIASIEKENAMTSGTISEDAKNSIEDTTNTKISTKTK